MSAHEQLKARVDLLEGVLIKHAQILQRQVIGNKQADQLFTAILQRLDDIEAVLKPVAVPES